MNDILGLQVLNCASYALQDVQQDSWALHIGCCSNLPSYASFDKNVSRHCQMSSGGQNQPQFRTIGLEFNIDVIVNSGCTDNTRLYIMLLMWRVQHNNFLLFCLCQGTEILYNILFQACDHPHVTIFFLLKTLTLDKKI